MRDKIISLVCILVFSSGSYCVPPTLKIDNEIEARGDYVTFKPETNATTVAYIGMSGIEPFPSELLKEQTTFILSVRGLPEGKYHFVAIGILENEYTRRDFIVRIGKVQPNPIPDPKPDPKLDDAPVETNGLHVIFIYESGQRVTQSQFNILYGNVIGTYLNTNCDRVNSQPNWRILDKDNAALSEPWKSALTRKRQSVPWVIVVSGKKYVYEGELKDTPEEFMKRLDQYKPKSRTDYCPNCPPQYRFQLVPIK